MSNNQYFSEETFFNNDVKFYQSVELSGNVYIDSGNLIMRSPNGTRYKLVVSDTGVLSTVALE
ncbi:hypothetical protein PQC13_gp045 [Synechococcus phage S-SRM01]|uniref:Uncharacterized protein n=1 Tax=Synechococcus phage S-SRM01 TaxID=2781608 RepID=A0A879R3T3_9CAUD|nr:hypothetical protein PQC13_gp045 [Synechococcus phage S-SRM01]QPX48010.1 hypothetical protein [Synechococcus phage S-SRM01]